MQRVPLDLVKPGMILAKPVVNEKGMPLCAEGTELTANLIERLRKMNVTTLSLRGHPVDTGEENKSKEQQVREMEQRFDQVKGNPLMDRLKTSIAKAIMSEDEEEDPGESEDEQG